MSDLLYLFSLKHARIDMPAGVLLKDDADIVNEGDLLIDNNRETPFVLVKNDNDYSELIGKTALEARLSSLCYEIYKI